MASSVEDKMKDLKVDESHKNDEEQADDIVDPWTVTSKSDTGVDYDKLISEQF